MLDPEPQVILDAICTRVGNRISPLFTGWSIGQRSSVVSTIAEYLSMTSSQIEEALEELIAEGLLTHEPIVPEWYASKHKQHLGITHQGWQQWSSFNAMYLDDWHLDSVGEWLASIQVPERDHTFESVYSPRPETPDVRKPQE